MLSQKAKTSSFDNSGWSSNNISAYIPTAVANKARQQHRDNTAL